MTAILNAFTVDVEDYYQVSAFEKHIPRERWGEYPSRVERNTRRMLDLLDRHQVRATFFILGWVAERFPHLAREIHTKGHEIACHGYWHQLIYHQTPDEFRADLRRARDVIQDACHVRPTAYRAPSFSITRQTRWAHDILVEEGFTVDSSVFPIYHDRYGIPGAPRHPHRVSTRAGSLMEFPPSVLHMSKINIPVSGGGYFRLFPYFWTSYCLRWLNRSTGKPFIFYVHPWECDPDQPRIHAASRASRFRHYVNLASNERKLDRLLKRFRFGSVSESLAHDLSDSAHTVSGTAQRPHIKPQTVCPRTTP